MINTWNIDEKLFYNQKALKDKIKFVLNYAVLAPSTHNSQPWLLEVGDDFCKIYVNSALYLEMADKDGRDLFISVGCLIENLIIASRYFNIYKGINFADDFQKIILGKINKNYLIAEIAFDDFIDNSGNKNVARLFSAITKRFNARGIFLDVPMEQSLIDEFKNLNDIDGIELNLVTDKDDIKTIARLTSDGMKVAHRDSDFRRELSKWINNLFSFKKQGMTWKSMRAPFVVSFCLSYLIRFFNLGKILSKLNYKSVLSAPLICVVNSEDEVKNWINVGIIAERIMLYAYFNKLNTSIYVAAIESNELRLQLKNVIQVNSRPQFLICVGYMNIKSIHTPRCDIKSKIISNSSSMLMKR